MRVWAVRTGRHGEYLDRFTNESLVGIIWDTLTADPLALERDALVAAVAAAYPAESDGTVLSWASQIWNFTRSMAVGDYVIAPHSGGKDLAVGVIAGEAKTTRPGDPDFLCVRHIDWIDTKMPASRLEQDFRNSLRSISTVFSARASGAPERLAAALKDGKDPGPGDFAPDTTAGGWVFQYKAAVYDVVEEAQKSRLEDWGARQLRDRMAIGNRVWFRRTGDEAGLYAVGQIISLPQKRDEPGEFGDWIVEVEYTALIEPPLLKADIAADATLSKVGALTGMQGTNLVIDEEIDLYLEELLSPRLKPLKGGVPKSRQSERAVNEAVAAHMSTVETEIVEALAAMPWDDFERLCLVLLEHLGYEDVKVTGAKHSKTLGDGGVDLTARMNVPGMPPIRVRAQAKRQQGNVSPGLIQQLRGTLKTAEHGIFLTTSRFTKKAQEEAVEDGKPPIGLLDGETIARRMIEHGIGVRETRVAVPRFDLPTLQKLVADGA